MAPEFSATAGPGLTRINDSRPKGRNLAREMQEQIAPMTQPNSKIVIIGAGIAGLCAAVYARKCGYEVELLEMHDSAGGLATSWHRGDYTFETCLHWFYGSRPGSSMYEHWHEIFDIEKLSFYNPDEFVRLVSADRSSLSIFSDVDRLEKELLEHAPGDSAAIHDMIASIRRLTHFEIPDPAAPWPKRAIMMLNTVPYLPELWRWLKITADDYGKRFTHPVLQRFFGNGEMSQLSALALILMLAWLNQGNASYVIGGSQAIIRLIVERFKALGGHLRFGAKVTKILVEHDSAVGVELANHEIIKADWVISAADGHATIFDLLGGRYRDKTLDAAYRRLDTFPSYLQVSLGIAMDLSRQPGFVTYLLDAPFVLDSTTSLSDISIRFFNFDPTFAPPGKTAVTCFLPTSNFDFWVSLQRNDPDRYKAEKQRVANTVIDILEEKVVGIRAAIEVVDVSTPATVIRYTGNWRGSMEGWLLTPKSGSSFLRNSLPGLRQFRMAGHWVSPGGGLPAGVFTARSAVRAICKEDHRAFAVGNA